MRILLSRTDALGDVVISLPVRERILSRMPEAEVHWLVRPYAAPLLENLGPVHLREPDTDLAALFRSLALDAVLNLSHRDAQVITAAKAAGVPIRVARPRGPQLWQATHRLWRGRNGTGRHEAENVLDFLKPWGWAGGCPTAPVLTLTAEERARGEAALAHLPRPRLGVATRSSGSSAYPSRVWWVWALATLEAGGWHPVILAPPEDAELLPSSLPPTDLRGLLGRIKACDAFLGPSTGPTQLAAALGVPLVALMGLSSNRGPSRWAPLGPRVQVVQYPGPEADLLGGMDRLDPAVLLPHLARFRGGPA